MLLAQVHAYDNNHIGLSIAYYSPLIEDIKAEGFEIDEYSGAFGLDFTYGIVDRVAIGMQFNYSHLSTNLNTIAYNNGNHLGSYSANVYQLWLKGDYHYSDDNFYRGTFYSSAAFGYMYTSANGLTEAGFINKNIPLLRELVYTNGLVYQVYPIAYKGQITQRFGGFLELGYGYQGFAKMGLYLRIDRSGKKLI